MGLPSYNDYTSDVKVIRRYFIGTTVLREGQLLGLDHDATVANADPKLRLGYAVEVLTASNLKRTVGFVAPGSAGQTGPCYVDILQPQSGDVVTAEVDGTTDVASGDTLEPDNTLGALIKGTAVVSENLYIALQVQAADSKVKILVQRI